MHHEDSLLSSTFIKKYFIFIKNMDMSMNMCAHSWQLHSQNYISEFLWGLEEEQ